VTEQNIITTQEAEKELASLESEAGEHFHNSQESFAKGILALHTIRDKHLWAYAKDESGIRFGDYNHPSFGDYLYHFCRARGISRSSIYNHLGTVDTWKKLGRKEEELIEIGLRKAAPVRKLYRVDGRTGEIKMPPREVLRALPPGKTPEERINAKIQEVFIDPPEPLSPTDIRKSFTVDIGTSEFNFFRHGDGGIWLEYDGGEEFWTGEVVSAKALGEMPQAAADRIFGRFGL